jgi:catechol 2,3-dioxygenase-like lactoylglutathione lyase family enzyme
LALKLEFHHINYVSKDVDGLHDFYTNILKMETIAPQNFPRTDATSKAGYDGKIKFATEGSMQMHLAERDLDVAARNDRHINPVERGHIAFRTDDIEGFKQHLRDHDIAFADYGTTFAAEWYQIFFHDPEGNIIEVHQQVA